MDALTFLLLLSVVGHTHLLQERNRGSDLRSIAEFQQRKRSGMCRNETLARTTCTDATTTCAYPLVPQIGALGNDAPSSCLQLSGTGLKSAELLPLFGVLLRYVICAFKGVIVDDLVLALCKCTYVHRHTGKTVHICNGWSDISVTDFLSKLPQR